jgi:cytoskeletal protein CcmA (bactofilin family)
MFGRTPPKITIDSLVGATTRIEGDLIFSGSLRIDGEVVGKVRCADAGSSLLVVSAQARVCGEVHCDNLVVDGVIEGPVHCRGLLELQPNARILGDVSYHRLEMQGGAAVTGRLAHQEAAPEPQFELASVAEPERPANPNSVRQSVMRAKGL